MPVVCAENSNNNGTFLINDRAVNIEELKRADLATLLTDEWIKLDHTAVATKNFFTGEPETSDWYYQVKPPIPTHWPPQQERSVTYYAYAEYREFMRHGPSLSRSAPWAKVVLTEGMPAKTIILTGQIGPVIDQQVAWMVPPSVQEQQFQVRRDGEKQLSNFINWQSIPDSQTEVKAIREYYCQWAKENGIAKLIRNDNQAFFEWLSC